MVVKQGYGHFYCPSTVKNTPVSFKITYKLLFILNWSKNVLMEQMLHYIEKIKIK